MSREHRDIFTQLDLNGPYLRVDSQPVDITKESVFGNSGAGRESRYTATFTVAVSTYYMTGDEADIGDRNIIEEDAVPPTVDNSGYIAYQWYEQVGATQNLDTDILLREGIDDTTGVTTQTLNITNLQSPEDNQRKFYCLLDYVPSQYETGNAVNETFTTNTATLTVLPHIIIDDQPQDVVGYINNDTVISLNARLSDPFFVDDLTYQWYEVPEGQELVPNIIEDGVFTSNAVNTSIDTEDIIENIIKEEVFVERVPFTGGGVRRISRSVGIPTEAVEVKFKIAGGSGGSGGDESGSWIGGSGGLGRYGEFTLNDDVITAIRNNGSRTNVIINAGRSGNDGPSNTSDPTAIGNGGSCAIEFIEDLPGGQLGNADVDFVQGSAGDGGFAGPGGTSGAGGGGGGLSSFQLEVTTEIRYKTEVEDGKVIESTFKDEQYINLGVSGGGGGGGGASLNASGTSGGTGDPFSVFSKTKLRSDIQQATPVNFNPACAETSDAINIEYGFYTKTATAKSDLVGVSPDRLVIIWDGDVVFDRSKANINVSNDSEGYFIQVGNTKYYASAHRSSLLGWCDDNGCGTCTRLATEAQDPNNIDINRETGGYANAFDITRVVVAADNQISIPLDFGGNGQDKLTGDGGGGGGAGAGAISPRDGGTAGSDPIPASNAPITVTVSGNASILGNRYIRMVPVAGGSAITFNSSNFGTREITIPAGSTWDIVSNVDDGLSSENIALLPDLGRSVGLDVFSDGQGDFDDLVVEFSDGAFKNVSRTIFNDGEFIGRSIIQYTAPTRNVNGTVATGGQGGQSAYMSDYVTKIDEGTHNGEGYTEVYIRTQKPYDQLTSDIKQVRIVQRVNYSGTRTNTLTIKADYSYSSRYMCRIRSTIASPIKVLDSRIAQLVMLDVTTNAITVEDIGTDGFARVSAVDLDNADLFFRPSTESGSQKTEYFSFWSPTDIDVDLQMYGGKGTNFNGNSGGNGGYAYMRLRMKANTEYVIAGLDEFSNTPFLFKKANLIASVGSGGHAGRLGNGGDGGGTRQGGSTALRGAAGAPLITPGSDGIIGSASASSEISPDTKASSPNGGQTLKCTKGTYWREQGLSPCANISGNSQFRLGDGTIVTNTASIGRGFKAGYNIFNTSGEGGKTGNQGRESDGGNGSSGGQGSINGYGGGGGGGYILEGPELFMRYTYFGDQDGVIPGSRVGINDGDPFVQISKVDVPTEYLTEFNEYPEDLVLDVDDIDVDDVDVFEPNPIVTVPDPAREPNPQVAIINPTFPRGTGTVYTVDEGSTTTFSVETVDIPPYSRIYWGVSFNGSDANDFTATTGHFDTTPADDGTSRCLGSFNVTISNDLSTEFVNGREFFGVNLFSDSARTIIVTRTPSNANFEIRDTSRTPPTALITSGTLPNFSDTQIELYEGETHTFNIVTTDIPLFPDVFPNGNVRLNWEVDPVSGLQRSDFVQPSGFVDISVFDPATSVTGTGSFNITTFEDFSTDGGGEFNMKLYYSDMTTLGLGTELFSGRGIRHNILVGDTSKDPVYLLTPASVTMDENAPQSGGSIGGDYDLDLGDTATFTLSTEWVTSGSTFYFKVVSGANNANGTAAIATADFTISSGTFTVTGSTTPGTSIPGSGTYTVQTNPEGALEGTEQFTVQVHKTTDSFGNAITYPNNASLVERSNITVIDTAKPYYKVLPNPTTMNEYGGTLTVGDTKTLTLSTNYIANGTQFYYQVVSGANNTTPGAAPATSDFSTASGTFTVSGTFLNSSSTFNVVTIPDGILEGNENFTIQIYQGANSSATLVTTSALTVNDTAFPIYRVTKSGTTNDFAETLDEGQSITLDLYVRYPTATNGTPTDPQTAYWKIFKSDGTSAADAADFDTPINDSFTVNTFGANEVINQITVTVKDDFFTDGANPEIFIIKVSPDINFGSPGSTWVQEEFTLSVNDTSITPTFTISGNTPITEIGPTTETYTLATTNVITSDDLRYEILRTNGTPASTSSFNDVNGSYSTNSIKGEWEFRSGNRGNGNWRMKLQPVDDFFTNGNQTYVLHVSKDGFVSSGQPSLGSFTFVVTDDSKTRGYTLTSNLNTVDEGGTIEFTLDTTNTLVNDDIEFEIVDSFGSGVSDVTPDNGNVPRRTGTRATGTCKFEIDIDKDEFSEGSVVYTCEIYNRDVDFNTIVASKDFTIRDTSKDAASYSLTSNRNNDTINEGASITYTLTSTNDTGGDDGRGGIINKGDTFTRYWRVGGESNTDQVNPYQGEVTMKVTSESGDVDTIAEGTFTIKAVEDYVDDGAEGEDDITYYDIDIYYKANDRNSERNAAENFFDYLGIRDSSIPTRKWGTKTGAFIGGGGYDVNEGSTVTTYFYTTDPVGTNFTYELDYGNNGDGDDFDLLVSEGQTRGRGGQVEGSFTTKTLSGYDPNQGTDIRSYGTIKFKATLDKETEGAHSANLYLYLGRDSVQVLGTRGGYVDNTIINIGDISLTPIPGCTDPNAEDYNPDAEEDDGTCEVILAGQMGGIHVWRYELPPDKYTSDVVANPGRQFLDPYEYPHRLYPHFPMDSAPAEWVHSGVAYNRVGRLGGVLWANKIPVEANTDTKGNVTCGNLLVTNTLETYDWYKFSGFDYLHNYQNRALGDLRYWFNPQDVQRDGVGYQLYGDRQFLFGTHLVPLYCVYKVPSLSANKNYVRRADVIYTTDRIAESGIYSGKADYWTYPSGASSIPYRYILGSKNGIMSNVAILRNKSDEPNYGDCVVKYKKDYGA